jgi:hypothetical protein
MEDRVTSKASETGGEGERMTARRRCVGAVSDWKQSCGVVLATATAMATAMGRMRWEGMIRVNNRLRV